MINLRDQCLNKRITKNLPNGFPYKNISATERSFDRHPGRDLLFLGVLEDRSYEVDNRLFCPLKKAFISVFKTDHLEVFDDWLDITLIIAPVGSELRIETKGALANIKFAVGFKKIIQIREIGPFNFGSQIKCRVLGQCIQL